MMPKHAALSPASVVHGITFTVETVTPDMAAAWLTRNEKNRNLNTNYVETLAADMLAGRFPFTGDAIRFDTTDRLIDGQHRLAAIVLTGVPVTIAVMRGLPPEAQESMDIGRSRTISDRLKMQGVSNTALRAGIARVVLGYEQGCALTVTAPKGVSTSHVIAYVANNDLDYGVLVGDTARRARIGTPSTVGAAAEIAYRHDPDGARRFFEDQLIGGLGLTVGEPALLLRNRMLATTTRDKRERAEMFWLMLHAFRLFQEGRVTHKLQCPKGGWAVDNLPQLRTRVPA